VGERYGAKNMPRRPSTQSPDAHQQEKATKQARLDDNGNEATGDRGAAIIFHPAFAVAKTCAVILLYRGV
jgi:hypothetical protein